MEHTEQQKAEFRREFALRRKRQLMLAVPLVAVIVGSLAFANEKAGTLLGMPLSIAGPAFLVLVAGALVFSLRNWRCPACDRYLGKGANPRFCPKCGVALQ